MRLVVITFLIILALGVFGLPFLVGAGAMMDHGFCVVAKIFGAGCPAEGIFGIALHHISSMGEMTLGVFSFAAALFAVLIFTSFITADALLSSHKPAFNPSKVFSIEPGARILRWISLHNKLDPHPVYFADARHFLMASFACPGLIEWAKP